MEAFMKKLLTLALVLAGLALQPSLAAADGNGLEWRRGGSYDVWYRHPGEHNWRRAPGSAREVADGWVIGTDRRNGGYSIYRWDGHRWHRMPGAGVHIGGGYYNPWVVNDRGERFSWNGYAWAEEPNFNRRNDGRRDERHDNGNRGRDDNTWNRGRDDKGHGFDSGKGESNWRREQNSLGDRGKLEDQWRRNRNR